MGCIYLAFGVGLAALTPTLMSYVADIAPPETLGRAFGWYTMSLYSGMTLGPAIGGFLGGVLGLRPIFVCSGSLILLMLVLAYRLLPNPPRRQRRVPETIGATLAILIRNHRLIACLLVTIGGCVGFGLFISFMPLYIRSLGMSTMTIGLVCATQALANAIARIPAGWLCDHIADRRILVITGTSILAMAMASFGGCSTLLPLVLTAALMGLSMGIAFTVICTLIVDAVPSRMRGLAMGCYNTSVYFGMTICALVMGVVIREQGFATSFFCTGGVILASVLVFGLLYRPQNIRDNGATDHEGRCQ